MNFFKRISKLILSDWMALVAVCLSFFIIIQAYQEGFQRDWQSISAKVIKVPFYYRPGSGGVGETGAAGAYCVEVEYEYVVNGIRHVSTRYSINVTTAKCDADKNNLKNIMLPVLNSEILIWYDKKNPGYAIMVKKFPIAYSLALIFSLFINLYFILHFIKLFKNKNTSLERTNK